MSRTKEDADRVGLSLLLVSSRVPIQLQSRLLSTAGTIIHCLNNNFSIAFQTIKSSTAEVVMVDGLSKV